MMVEAAKTIFSLALRPKEAERDRPQVVAERGGKFACIENDADKQLAFCKILLKPLHMVEIPFFYSRSGLDFNAKQCIIFPF